MKPVSESTVTTADGRVLTEADLERLAEESDRALAEVDLRAGGFCREFKGGYEDGIDGELIAVTLDPQLDEQLEAVALSRGAEPATLIRQALAEFLDRPPQPFEPQPVADLRNWQWLVHLDAANAQRLTAYAVSSGCHTTVVVNQAVRRWLDDGISCGWGLPGR